MSADDEDVSQPPPSHGQPPQAPSAPGGHGVPPSHAPYVPQHQAYTPPAAPPGPPQVPPFAPPHGQSPPGQAYAPPHAQPPQHQPYAPPYGQPPAPPQSTLPLGDRVPGAVGLDMYTESTRSLWSDPAVASGQGLQPPPPAPPTPRPSGWNAPAFGMLAIFLVALTALLWPQYRARVIEHKAKPLVSGLSGRDAGARCPRYITAIFTNVGSVSFDANGTISDHTDLTGPICDGLRRFYTPEGKAEMDCLITDGVCSEGALRSVVALSVVAHESMHLAGEHNETQAECRSIAAGVKTAQLVGLTPAHGRMIAWAHYAAMNPNTPEEYSLTLQNCPSLVELEENPPGTESSRAAVTAAVEHTWVTLGED